jgi:hypothetical protein
MDWEVGIGGLKPAKYFTPIEKGAYKATYCCMIALWDQILKMVNRGYAIHIALDKIYECYGQSLFVSKFMDLIVRTKKAGGLATLR